MKHDPILAPGARVHRATLAFALVLALLALAAPAAAEHHGDASVSEPTLLDGDLDRAAVEKRIRRDQAYWTVQLVLTSSFAAVPLTARQIQWGINRSCDPSDPSCGTGYAPYADIFWLPFSFINLGLGVPCVLGAKLSLMTIKRELGEASSAGVLAQQWRRRGDKLGLASALTAGIGIGSGMILLAIGDGTNWSVAEVGVVMAIGSAVSSLVLLHIALPHAVMAAEVERTAGIGRQAARRHSGPRLTAISPLGISGVW